ncbi:hypothetical protein [Virgibacillus senegalensis]|uniref:hypothetical protein n=1 Tax=Virgibacillus senegalensis TaxID=1499679 RepID=UPI00069DFE9F|nr:hypothetical protein [Virgibacillus senegalensis]
MNLIKTSFRTVVMVSIMLVAFTGCQQQDDAEKIDVEGEVTLIEKEEQLLYIDGNPILVQNPDHFQVGQQVTAELIDTNPHTDWDPEQIVVENIDFHK